MLILGHIVHAPNSASTFINCLALKDDGFKSEFKENRRPTYHPTGLLRLFIYGYLNGIRSSRHFEKKMKRSKFMNALSLKNFL
jgi:transposase